MATQCAGQNLGAFDTQPNTIVFDSGKRCLGNAAQLRQLVLAEALQLANDANGLADRNPWRVAWQDETGSFRVSDSRVQ